MYIWGQFVGSCPFYALGRISLFQEAIKLNSAYMRLKFIVE